MRPSILFQRMRGDSSGSATFLVNLIPTGFLRATEFPKKQQTPTKMNPDSYVIQNGKRNSI